MLVTLAVRAKDIDLANKRLDELDKEAAGIPAPVRFSETEFREAVTEALERLPSEFAKALKDPEFAARMRGMGLEIYGTTPAQFGQFIRDENAKWAKVIKATGARID